MKFTERLEDGFEDVIRKASSGLGIGLAELSRQAGIPAGRVASLMKGNYHEEDCLAVARVLDLDGTALGELAKGQSQPGPVELAGLIPYTTPYPVPGYEEMTVNSYLVYDPESLKAALFDTGTDIESVLADACRLKLSIEQIFLTHSHGDHIQALEDFLKKSGPVEVWINEKEPLPGTMPFGEGKTFSIGQLKIRTALTNGHSPGGTTFVISGLIKQVAIVGDSLFSCSQGGAPSHYQLALQNNREKILKLSDETVLCPGHGPMTTVAWEKQHNAFFSAAGAVGA